MRRSFFVLFFLLSLTISVYSQEEAKSLDSGEIAGTLYTVEEANEKFGEVVKSSVFSKSELLELAKKGGNYLMFGFIDDECAIYDQEKSIIFGSTNNNELDVYYVYSTSKIIELLTQEDADAEEDDEVIFEQRDGTLTITYNGVTMEDAFMCPPYC